MANKKLIEKLTSAQETQASIYLEKWLKQGLRTDQLDKIKAMQSVNWIYKTFLKQKPPRIFFADSPWQATMLAGILNEISGEPKKGSQLGSGLVSQLRSQLGSQLGSQLR